MNAFKEQSTSLRKRGYTLPEIVRATGRAKTSIYFHIRRIPLSQQKIAAIRKASGARIRKYALARKGKSTKPFKTIDTWTPDTVLLLGHLLFDGEILRSKCTYNNRSPALINRVERLMENVYLYEPKRYANSTTGVIRISYFNVALGNYLKSRGVDLVRRITKLPLDLKREFLRAFFDDEGCMDFRLGGRKRIRGYQKNVRILRIIRELLLNFGIEARITPPNEVVIVGKQNLLCFEREINFSSGIYINGKRTNSRWKKHLEKRELLRRAIESFKN